MWLRCEGHAAKALKTDHESSMKAIDRPYPKIINGASQFVIPVFQRDYSWSEENWPAAGFVDSGLS